MTPRGPGILPRGLTRHARDLWLKKRFSLAFCCLPTGKGQAAPCLPRTGPWRARARTCQSKMSGRTRMSAPRRRRFTWMTILIAAFAMLVGVSLPAAAQPAATPTTAAPAAGNGVSAGPPGSTGNGAGQLVPMPALPKNICHNSACRSTTARTSRPRATLTGSGFANQTAIGWDGNYYAPFDYLSGSYFARGVPTTYTPGGTELLRRDVLLRRLRLTACRRPGPQRQSVQWTEAERLPARHDHLVHPRQRRRSRSPTSPTSRPSAATRPMLVYTRVAVTNNGIVGGQRRRPAARGRTWSS